MMITFEQWWRRIESSGDTQLRSAREWARLGWFAGFMEYDVIETLPVPRETGIVFEAEVKVLVDRPNEPCLNERALPSNGVA